MIRWFLRLIYDDVEAIANRRRKLRLLNICLLAFFWFLTLPCYLLGVITHFLEQVLGPLGWGVALAVIIWLYFANLGKMFDRIRRKLFPPGFLRRRATIDFHDVDTVQLVVLSQLDLPPLPALPEPPPLNSGPEKLPLGWHWTSKTSCEGDFLTDRGSYKGRVEKERGELKAFVYNPGSLKGKLQRHQSCFQTTHDPNVCYVHLKGKIPTTFCDCIVGTNDVLKGCGA